MSLSLQSSGLSHPIQDLSTPETTAAAAAAPYLHLDADASDLIPPHPVAADVVAPRTHKVVRLKGREAQHTHVVAGHTLDQELGLQWGLEERGC